MVTGTMSVGIYKLYNKNSALERSYVILYIKNIQIVLQSTNNGLCNWFIYMATYMRIIALYPEHKEFKKTRQEKMSNSRAY